ncbi:MAG: serine/threonine-protein kinase, partial [Myxococcota bacterium]|nr:serine/threonine-protein kinase [Myxococcota bacterium]
MSDSMPPSLGEGRYELSQVLGDGGMATVYRARDSILQVERAIKVMATSLATDDRMRTRFLTEARTMAMLRHPNIVTVYDVGMEGSRPYIVMEMISGGTLMELISDQGFLPVEQACGFIAGMLRGLHSAHEQGVVHRDVKPHNLLITSEGTPKLTDFGIARIMDSDHQLTKSGASLGTLAYMPPEQMNDAHLADFRADIFAAGATLFTSLTGRGPHGLYATSLHDDLLKDIPKPIARVIKKACRYHPTERFESAKQMADALEYITDHATLSVTTNPRPAAAAGFEPFGGTLSDYGIDDEPDETTWTILPILPREDSTAEIPPPDSAERTMPLSWLLPATVSVLVVLGWWFQYTDPPPPPSADTPEEVTAPPRSSPEPTEQSSSTFDADGDDELAAPPAAPTPDPAPPTPEVTPVRTPAPPANPAPPPAADRATVTNPDRSTATTDKPDEGAEAGLPPGHGTVVTRGDVPRLYLSSANQRYS